MNEMSFESLMAVGTGLASPESKESKINGVPFDGYSDGVDMDLARTSEQLHFVDTYDKLQSLHSAEKLKMIKKISTAYNVKTIGNANVANSVESFCNNAMSTEGIKEAAATVKAKFVEIFKKIAEFFKNLVIKIVTVKYKGKVAENLKATLKYNHDAINSCISAIQSKSDEKITPEVKEVLSMYQKTNENDRKLTIEILKFFNRAAKVARKTGPNKKIGIDDVVDTDEIANMKFADDSVVSGGYTVKKMVGDAEEAANNLNSSDYKKIKDHFINSLKSDGINIEELKKDIEFSNKIYTTSMEKLVKANEKLSQDLKNAKDKKGAAPSKDVAASPAPAAGQNA